MYSWQEIQKKFKDEWVAMADWEEDEHGDVKNAEVVYHASDRKNFYSFINTHYRTTDLAIRYTGNIKGPFLFDT